MAEYTLLIILFALFVGVVVLMFVPNRQALQVRLVAAAAAGVCMLASFYMFFAYDPARGGFQFVQRFEWSKQLGIAFYLGVDGIGTPLVLASSILLFAGIFISWHIKDRTKEFYIFLLILAAATIGVFMSLDMFFLYFFYEMSVIPMYVLLGVWGSHTKGYLDMTDPEGLKKRDSVGFIFNFAAKSTGPLSIIRISYATLPEATLELMTIAPVLCVFNIINGGFVAVYAKDTKYVSGYSSSSHMVYVFLGMAALDYISLTGGVLYMFAHALATGMLFAMAGWVYDQTHSRHIPELGGLVNRMPFVAGCFSVACMASVAMRGTANFIAEIMILVGSWGKYPFQVIVAVVGIVLTLAYLFRMMRGLFYGPMDAQYSHAHDAVSIVDRLPLLLMIGCSIVFGIFPGHFYDVIRSSVDPLLARIAVVAPLAAENGDALRVTRDEFTRRADNLSPITRHGAY